MNPSIKYFFLFIEKEKFVSFISQLLLLFRCWFYFFSYTMAFLSMWGVGVWFLLFFFIFISRFRGASHLVSRYFLFRKLLWQTLMETAIATTNPKEKDRDCIEMRNSLELMIIYACKLMVLLYAYIHT